MSRAGADKAASEGGYCRVVQRPISRVLAPRVARYLGPNAVTTVDLVTGLLAGLAVWAGQLVLGAILVQIFGVLSCVDGDVARARGQASAAGDFYDTMTDRIAETVIILALAGYESRHAPGRAAVLALLAAVLLLVVSSEKFRSAFRHGYPKQTWEPVFSWVSAGSDARLLVITCALLVVAATGTPALLPWFVTGLAAVAWLNLAWRAAVLVRQLNAPTAEAEARN